MTEVAALKQEVAVLKASWDAALAEVDRLIKGATARAAQVAKDEEREACAKVADAQVEKWHSREAQTASKHIAVAIRARGAR